LFSVFLPCCCYAARGDKRLIQFISPDNEIDVTGFILSRLAYSRKVLSKKEKRKANKEEAKQRKRDGEVFKPRNTYPRKDPMNSQW